MRYLAFACDYDGTLATDGQVPDEAVEALERLRASARRLILVTGRELDDLRDVFDRLDLFDLAVVENGAVVYHPDSKETTLLAERPPGGFVTDLRRRGVDPLSVGHVIVSSWEPNETTVLEAIRDHGLELEIIFNKGAVMVLPSGVNKAAGLRAALAELEVSPRNVVGIGDAENDLAFLRMCECAAAVANALPSVKEACDHVTEGDHGAGVVEMIDRLLEDDLRSLDARLTRHDVLLGLLPTGEGRRRREFRIPPARVTVLLSGPSASGKSTLTTGFLERLREHGYQFCVIDPEGDYQSFQGGIVLGDAEHGPGVDEVMNVLSQSDQSVVVNLLGLGIQDRPSFFDAIVARLQDLRARTGRPHWVVIDEAHHLLPAEREAASLTVPRELGATFLVTVHPDHLSKEVLSQVDLMVAVGEDAPDTVGAFARSGGRGGPSRRVVVGPGQALAWWAERDEAPVAFDVVPPKERMKRHRRKYVEGELGPDKSFYFRGPDARLNLRAQNLALFAQLAQGVDDDTWLHHLRQGDYSRWFRDSLKDEELAAEAERIEKSPDGDAETSRSRMQAAINERYTI